MRKAVYKLLSKADADLAGIYEYTILNFGLEQASAYLLGLHERFAALAASVARKKRSVFRDYMCTWLTA